MNAPDLEQLIQQQENSHRLSLENCYLGDQRMLHCLNILALKQYPFKSIILKGNNLTEDILEQLSKVLLQLRTVVFLDLSWN
jgi:hypothetical protein